MRSDHNHYKEKVVELNWVMSFTMASLVSMWVWVWAWVCTHVSTHIVWLECAHKLINPTAMSVYLKFFQLSRRWAVMFLSMLEDVLVVPVFGRVHIVVERHGKACHLRYPHHFGMTWLVGQLNHWKRGIAPRAQWNMNTEQCLLCLCMSTLAISHFTTVNDKCHFRCPLPSVQCPVPVQCLNLSCWFCCKHNTTRQPTPHRYSQNKSPKGRLASHCRQGSESCPWDDVDRLFQHASAW